MSSDSRRRFTRRSTQGSCTPNCSALPATEPHASRIASRSRSTPRAERQQRPDHGHVPDHRRGIREQESAMAVQNPQAPRRHHQQPDAGKQNAHDADGELALGARESGRDDVDQVRRRSTPSSTKHRRHQSREWRRSRPPRAPLRSSSSRATSAAYTGMNDADSTPSPNRFCRKLGMRQRRRERVRFVREAEIMGEHPLPHQPHHAAEQNARGDEERILHFFNGNGTARPVLDGFLGRLDDLHHAAR